MSLLRQEAGQHGVATAAAARDLVWLDVYMGQKMWSVNVSAVFRMEMMGATVHAVEALGLVPSKMRLMQPLEHG